MKKNFNFGCVVTAFMIGLVAVGAIFYQIGRGSVSSADEFQAGYHAGYKVGYNDGNTSSPDSYDLSLEYQRGLEDGYLQAINDSESEFDNFHVDDFVDMCYHYTGVRVYSLDEYYELDEARHFFNFAYYDGYLAAMDGYPLELTWDTVREHTKDIYYTFGF